MVGVSIAFVITGHYIENYRKLLTEEEILKARETASDSRKHSPATQISLALFLSSFFGKLRKQISVSSFNKIRNGFLETSYPSKYWPEKCNLFIK